MTPTQWTPATMGRKGGHARAASTTREQRQTWARRGAAASAVVRKRKARARLREKRQQAQKIA